MRCEGTSDNVLPGERLDGESDKAFKAFACYRDMQPHERSTLAVYRWVTSRPHARAPSGNFQYWCAQYQWVERAALWDEYVDEQRRAARIEEIKAMEKEHAALASDLVKVSRLGAKALLLRLQANERKAARKSATEPFVGVKTRDLVRLAEVAVKLERLTKGEPTDIGKLKEEVQMTYAELMIAASEAKR